MFQSYDLVGKCLSELNTEMRFLFASAKVDGEEITRLVLPFGTDDRENARINGCAIKVLRTLKKDKIIQFYVNKEGFAVHSTEASFLINKYAEFVTGATDDPAFIYVKL